MDYVTHIRRLLKEQVDLNSFNNIEEINNICDLFGRLVEELDAPAFSVLYVKDKYNIELDLYVREVVIKKDSLFWGMTNIVDEIGFKRVGNEEINSYQFICDKEPPEIIIEFRYNVKE